MIHIEVTEWQSKEMAKAVSNLAHTFRNQIKHAIGKHEDICFCYDCGTVRAADGLYYDWFKMPDGSIVIDRAE